MTYQWYIGESGTTTQPIDGATRATYTTPPLTTTTSYWVRLTDATGATDSETATVRLTASDAPGTAPVITIQPADRTVSSGQSALLKIRARGSKPLAYQWYSGTTGSTATPIRGATSKAYTIPSLTTTTSYWARVSNRHGSVDSQSATVTVTVSDPEAPPEPDPDPDPAPDPDLEPDPDPDPDPEPDPDPDPDPEPEPDPTPVSTSSSFEQQVIALVNQHRAAGVTCGGSAQPPVGPLSEDTSLRTAARGHSADMAAHDYFSHTSLDGRTFSQRIQDAGYAGGFPMGENIAAGTSTPQAVVNAWMASSGHCSNIMNGGYNDVGVGYGYLAGSTYGHYWTQDFGGD